VIRNVSKIDTTPGAEGENSMFSPSATFTGGRADYFQFLEEKEGELYAVTWWFTGPDRLKDPEVIGPYADDFRDAFNKVRSRRMQAAAAAARARG
jgi:hypothetical protein